ncbi:flagellar biosynthesis regulator FlaF [Geobacter pelophilus]|uniref:Flagellar biosynthesis regulator FlaF n=1 Tax=Geoanaerobacter pelophilus TaxID=60036 RepID=A0AAW4L361_9BACT|nr:flagellar biosynthesis regulator FlaF [Geoanaerobacter pelophilus]MBT0663935.1 flagellar biosynthesis regulator FlaF [Geoanaerobacter pelophilus]
MQKAAFNTYAAMQKDGLTGRALEAAVLNRAANMLKECQTQWGTEGHDERFDAAVTFNQRVWTFFQAELSDPENPFPSEIKENILNLSIFIDRRLIEVLMNPAPELLSAVISINQNIAAGLMEKPDNDGTKPVAEPGTLTVSA